MFQPKITIVTPSYNQGQLIEETICSVLDQNYPGLEYIVIDGGSTDETLDVIKRYEHKLAYWVSEPDKGQSAAINKGLKQATGDIVSWLNSDDLYMPDALDAAAKCFAADDTALVHGKTILFGEGMADKIKGAVEDDLEVRYLAGIPFPQPSSFFKRSVLLEQGFLNESLHYGMDYDLFARIALNYPVRRVENVFSRYRLHSESKSVAQSVRFTYDWAATFSRILRSFDSTMDLIGAMREVGLYVEGEDCYQRKKGFTKAELRRALLYFVETQIGYYYENLDLQRAGELARFVKNFDAEFYRTHGLNKFYWRAKVLNKSGVKFLRKFTR